MHRLHTSSPRALDTARLWRDRWGELQGIDQETLSIAERLQDALRPGAPARITVEQCCQIAALACEVPMKAGRRISQWTVREIADELKKQGIVDRSRLDMPPICEKYGGSNRTASGIG